MLDGKNTFYAFMCMTVVIMISGCATKVTLPSTCGLVRTDVCIGSISAPKSAVDSLQLGAQQAIDVIYSMEFEAALQDFQKENAGALLQVKAWSGFDNAAVVEKLRAKIKIMRIETKGGPFWYLRYKFAGNLARDGAGEGPIQLNEWAFPRSPSSFANSIAHEIAHKAGLIHPSSSANFLAALCEPPYIVGTLVEGSIVGKHLIGQDRHCNFSKAHTPNN
jgi:hypothetical protein